MEETALSPETFKEESPDEPVSQEELLSQLEEGVETEKPQLTEKLDKPKQMKKIVAIIVAMGIILAILSGIFLLGKEPTVDMDKDGIPDSKDEDDDNDGILDVNDAFPLDATEWTDTDGDGIGDNADSDDDNDGVIDTEDAFPLDAAESLDTDDDGIGDNADTDNDGDGISDDMETNTYGSNPLDSLDVQATSGVLLYDPTGESYTIPRPQNIAYLVITTSETNPSDREIASVIEITLTETMPAVISGDFVVVTSSAGINYIHNTSLSSIRINSSNLSTTMNNYYFQNVELDFNSVSIVYDTHTFGIGIGEVNDYQWASFDELLTFYNDVQVTGTVLPMNLFNEVGVFNIDLTIDEDNFKNTFDMDIQGSQTSFLMINTIEYGTQEIIKGDAFEVVTPEEIASLGYDLLGGSISSTGSNYLINISKNIGEQLVTFGESDNTVENSVLWFILTLTGLYEEKLSGVVELRISEGNISTLVQKMGISFDSTANYPIVFKIGICEDVDPFSNSSYENKEIRELWDQLAESHPQTIVGSVSVDCFAYVVTLEDAMEKLGMDSLTIESITSFKNPAFAFLIDQDFTDFIGSDDEFLNYTGIAFISNFLSKEKSISFLNIRGILYDTGMFLNSSNLQYPLIIADNYANNTPDLVEATLADLYNDPESHIGENLITTIKTEGRAIGTTISTVNQQDYPIDVGVYDLSDKSGSIFYHVPVINVSLEQGETYLGEYMSIIGFYVNLSKAMEILANSSELAGSEIFSGMFSDIIHNFTADNEAIKMLKGFIFSYEMVRKSISSNYSVLIYAENLSYSGEGNRTLEDDELYAEIEKTGGEWWQTDLVEAKFVVTSPTGQMFYAYSWPTIANPFDDILSQKIYPDSPNDLTITIPIWQTYTVEVYLIDIDGFGNVLAYNSTTFSVNTIPSITGVTIIPVPAYTDRTLTANPIGWNDSDGDPEGYEYQWWIKEEGALLWETISGATYESLNGSNFERGDLIKVKVTPFDGKHHGASVMSSEIIINNSKPSITGASIIPTVVYEATTLNTIASGWYDADGDSEDYNYQWYNQNGPIPSATSSTLTGVYFDKDDEIYCIITPDDGEDTGDPETTNSVTILNSPPTMTGASIYPDPAYENNILNATASGWYDVDGDAEGYTYQWYNQSGEILGAINSILLNTSFTRDDQIYCIITPFDGVDHGSYKLSQIVTIKAVGTPHPVKLNRPIEPTFNSLNLTWNESYEPDFLQYEVYKSTTSGFTLSPLNLVTTISSKTITFYVVNGLSENTEYYFIVRVNDTTGLYSDSNEVIGATQYNGDSGDDFSTANNVSSRMAWSEHIDGAFVGNSLDYFEIYLTAGQTLTINMTVPSGCNFDLYLYNTTQQEVDKSESPNPYEEVSTIATEDGYYYIKVWAPPLGGGAGVYSLYFIIS